MGDDSFSMDSMTGNNKAIHVIQPEDITRRQEEEAKRRQDELKRKQDELNREKFLRELEEFRLSEERAATASSDYGEMEDIDHQDYYSPQDEEQVEDYGDYGEAEEIEHEQYYHDEEAAAATVEEEDDDDDAIIPELMDMESYREGHHAVVEEEVHSRYDSSGYPTPSPNFRKEDTRQQPKARKKKEPEPEPLMGKVQVEQQSTLSYSVTHAIYPGSVADLTSSVLQAELSVETGAPLLLYIYNKWFGPCLEMTSEIESAAFRLGTKARVAKLDGDKYPAVVEHLQVDALPTTLVMNGNRVYRKVEGSLQTETILCMVDAAL